MLPLMAYRTWAVFMTQAHSITFSAQRLGAGLDALPPQSPCPPVGRRGTFTIANKAFSSLNVVKRPAVVTSVRSTSGICSAGVRLISATLFQRHVRHNNERRGWYGGSGWKSRQEIAS